MSLENEQMIECQDKSSKRGAIELQRRLHINFARFRITRITVGYL